MFNRTRTVAILVCLLASSTAWSVESDSRTIAITTSYGMLGGVGLGLLSIPLTRDTTSVVYGALVGLYIGLGAGIYHTTHRDDPENPLRASVQEKKDTIHEKETILFAVNVPVARF